MLGCHLHVENAGRLEWRGFGDYALYLSLTLARHSALNRWGPLLDGWKHFLSSWEGGNLLRYLCWGFH